MSVDGYIDDGQPERLMLSNAADFDRVDAVRAECDAILVGADTVRRDNPRLMVRSAFRRDRRSADGRPASPVKVTITRTGNLDPAACFFAAGEAEKLVYCETGALPGLTAALGDAATVVDAGEPTDLRVILADLHGRGIQRLMVEGGGRTHTQFLTLGLVDELHLVVAPFFVGDSSAPRFVGDGIFPFGNGRRMALVGVEQLDDVVLLRYDLAGAADG
ncbi:MAG TPA: dihydrofolate reductase family protein [Pseudonocardiaceae bacterium]